MRKKVFAELRAFAPRYVLPVRLIQCIVMFGAGFFLCLLFGWVAVQAFLPSVIYIDLLLDYAVFSGISMRRQKAMEWVKSSAAGGGLIKGALAQDLTVRAASTVSGYLGVLVCALGLEEDRVYALLAPVVFIPLAIAVTNTILLISHRIGGTIVTIYVLYLAGMIAGEVLAVLVGVALFGGGRDDFLMIVIKSVIAFAVMTVLAAVTSMVLLKDGKRGYESGFEDTDPLKAEDA